MWKVTVCSQMDALGDAIRIQRVIVNAKPVLHAVATSNRENPGVGFVKGRATKKSNNRLSEFHYIAGR